MAQRLDANHCQGGIDDRVPVETQPFLGFVRRVIRSAGRRVAAGDIEALRDLVAVRDDLEAAIAEAVKGLRSDWDYSWADIGRVTGTTRQAAQQRYGSGGADPGECPPRDAPPTFPGEVVEQTFPEVESAIMEPVPLPPSTQLRKSYKISHEGKTDSGPLVADEKGIGVDVVSTTKVSFAKKQSVTRRYYITSWSDVTGYEIGRPAANMLGGSTINSHDLTFTVKTAATQHAFLLHLTDEVRLRNQLGPYLAQVDQRS
ncbi:MAG: hypothetical protein QOK39_122 [Acidimicrobiaceae bacterium]|jgi:hypothetical protein|nr:hypothetical protein [Acidimicrobiaceae bacterium]